MSASEKLLAYAPGRNPVQRFSSLPVEVVWALVAVVEADEGLIKIAEGLFQMIPEQTWRDSGGDDGQGHYEGEYRAAQIREGFAQHRVALAALDEALGSDVTASGK